MAEAAGIALTDGDRAQIERCDEPATLDEWILRTRAARRRDEVFGPA